MTSEQKCSSASFELCSRRTDIKFWPGANFQLNGFISTVFFRDMSKNFKKFVTWVRFALKKMELAPNLIETSTYTDKQTKKNDNFVIKWHKTPKIRNFNVKILSACILYQFFRHAKGGIRRIKIFAQCVRKSLHTFASYSREFWF